MHILTLTSLFPNTLQPVHAVFVRTRMENFTRKFGHAWSVVAPVPWFPRLPFKTSPAYDAFARVPVCEEPWGYPIHHPRFLLTPKVGMRFYGSWMARSVIDTVKEIHRRKPIDVIDGHYVFPDGTAAIAAGRALGIPVILSARGTDLNLYPQIKPVAPRIKENLDACRHLICVCEDLRQVALGMGMPPAKVTTIGNGVDAERFRRGDAAAARQALGLPADATVLLSVGHLTERKGFRPIIEAVGKLKRPELFLAIAGAGPQRPELESVIAALGLQNRVRLSGAVANKDLTPWYQAADFFVLASSREGWPNVLCEAQASGLPIVATKVWGIPEIVKDASLGVLVDERSAEGLRVGLETALGRSWDRAHIEAVGRSRTWSKVADELAPVFDGALG